MTTLPIWVWGIYYLFLLVTLSTSIFGIIKGKIRFLSVLALLLTIILPICSFAIAIGRTDSMHEFEYIFQQSLSGDIAAIFILVGYLFLLVWWGLFLFKNRRRNRSIF